MRRRLGWLGLALALAAAAGAPAGGCRRPPESPVPEVALHATVGERAVEVLAAAAVQRRVARPRLVDSAVDAEVLWTGDPTEIVGAGDAVALGAAPEVPDVPVRYRDPQARFAPLCSRAELLLVSPRAALPFPPRNLRDLADPRLAGRIAVPPLSAPPHATAMAALAVAYGRESLERFLVLLAGNAPFLAAGDGEVRARVVAGEAGAGVVSSEEGAAAALSAARLEVVVPDQGGRGAVVVPTAVALTRRGRDQAPARALAAFLVGAEAERLLVARVPGFMPLRPEVPVPEGVRPAGNVKALRLDWDRVAAERAALGPRLQRWPGR